MNILKKFLSVFGIHLKRGDLERDEIVRFIRDTLYTNFQFITGNKQDLAISKIRIEEFDKLLSEIKSGFTAGGFSASEQLDFMMFYPIDYVKEFLPAARNTHALQDESDMTATMKLMDWTLGSISRLFYLEKNESGVINTGNFYMMKKAYIPADRDGILWNASGSTALQINTGKSCIFLLFSEEIEHRLRVNLNKKGFAKSISSMMLPEYDSESGNKEEETEVVLDIKKPKEFITGNFFIPQIARFDNFRIRSSFNRITITGSANEHLSREGLWIRAALVIGESENNLYYLFPEITRNDFTEKFGEPNNFFKNILREMLLFIKNNCPDIAVKSVRFFMEAKPDASFITNSAILNAGLILGYSRIEAVVYVPEPFFTLLYSQFLNPWEYRLIQSPMRNSLVSTISLNNTVFNRNVKSFFKKFKDQLAYMPVVTTCIPFYELIDLIDDRDLRIIIQNLLIPIYSSDIAMLFNIAVPSSKKDSEQKPSKALKIFQVDYNRDRVKKCLPVMIQEEIAHQAKYCMADEFDTFNRNVMKEIIKALAGDKITISYKTRYIFIHEIFDTIKEEHSRRLNELKEQGIPFTKIQKLPKSRRINFINRIGNRDLCIIVIDTDNEINILLECMSRNRKSKFLDDMEYYKQLYMSSEISPEDIINAKLKVDALLEKELLVK